MAAVRVQCCSEEHRRLEFNTEVNDSKFIRRDRLEHGKEQGEVVA